MPWVQALKHIRFPDASGKRVMRFPGEILFWPNKKEAMALVEDGHLAFLDIGDKAPEGSGVVWRGKGAPPGWLSALGFEIVEADFECPFPVTVVLGPGIKVQAALLLLALNQFVKAEWDMAVPLISYRKLAEDVGTVGERERTKEVIHDLRTPLYATNLVLLKDGPAILTFIELFNEERAGDQHEGLAFLRALYRSDVAFWALQKELCGDR